MNPLNQTKEELLKELKKLRKEHNALKASYEKYNSEHKAVEDALRVSEENFRVIFENNSAAMSIMEPDTTISMVNEEYCKASGYTSQEVIGMSWTQQIPPQDLEKLKEYNRSRLINPKNTPDKYEFTFYHKNGEIRHSMMSITILSNGKRIASFIDITAHKQAEVALKESEEKYSKAFQTSPYAIAITSAEDGKLIEINDAFTSITGFTQEDITADSAVNLNIWVDIENRKRMLSALTEGSEVKGREFQFRKKNGEIILGLFSAQIIHLNEKPFILSSTQDITQRKQAEEALLQEQSLMSALMDSIPDHIYFKNRESRFFRNNKAHIRSFGTNDPEFLKNKSDFDFFLKEVAQKQYDDEQEIIRTGQSINKEEFTVRNDGSTNWYYSTKMPLRDKNGIIVGTFGISRDITDRKLTEEELKLKNEQLNKANAEKDKFFSIIAHDLRSPFNSLLGFTELLEKELPTMTRDQIQQIAVTMRKSATNLYALLENLLEWSRLQRGLTTYNPEPILLMPKVLADTALVMDSANTKEITLNYDIPEDLKVYADENMLGGILRNLTSNAVKFTPKGGKVIISAKPLDNSVECSVSDTGIGMNQEIKENLFNIDVNTSRKGTNKEPSTGLGLIICREFVGMHGGRLWVESEEGKGSTSYFTLPGRKDETQDKKNIELK